MESSYAVLLSLIVFLPTLGALVLAFMPQQWVGPIRFFTLLVTLAVFVLTLLLVLPGMPAATFDIGLASMQKTFSIPWIPSFEIYYFLGLDGISLPLVLLTSFVSVLAMGASWSVTKYVKAYCILFLLLETGMLGVFMALDFFLFYVFWEVMLLPMYFLIGVWGGPRKEYAAIKFFLYTLLGSVLMLVAVLMLYFNSDLGQLLRLDVARTGAVLERLHLPNTLPALGMSTTRPADRPQAALTFLRRGADADAPLAVRFDVSSDGGTPKARYDRGAHEVTIRLTADQQSAAAVLAAVKGNADLAEVVDVVLAPGSDGQDPVAPEDSLVGERAIAAYRPDAKVHTFNLLALAEMGQSTDLFDAPVWGGWSVQHWAFLLLFIGFVIKVPSVPLHTWLPDAHVEAPTPISMILAGVLLKMGGYGIVRICYPICPHAGYDLAMFVCGVGVLSMVYGAFAALAQRDFKRMVAYSSVSHMGYVVVGLGVWSATAATMYNPEYWNMGVKGALFQMIAHGISSAGMFFMVGVIYDRVHHRDLEQFGGLFGRMPLYTALAIGIFFAGLGLPGLCGFIGEVLVVLSIWSFSKTLAVISAAVVILTAGYILWAIQRVYLGAEYRGPHGEDLTPMTLREISIAMPLFVLAIVFGIFPSLILRYMDKTVDHQVQQLAQWTQVLDQKSQSTAHIAPIENQQVRSDLR